MVLMRFFLDNERVSKEMLDQVSRESASLSREKIEKNAFLSHDDTSLKWKDPTF